MVARLQRALGIACGARAAGWAKVGWRRGPAGIAQAGAGAVSAALRDRGTASGISAAAPQRRFGFGGGGETGRRWLGEPVPPPSCSARMHRHHPRC